MEREEKKRKKYNNTRAAMSAAIRKLEEEIGGDCMTSPWGRTFIQKRKGVKKS